MKKRFAAPFLALLVAVALQGCHNNNGEQECTPIGFPQVQVPSYIYDNSQAIDYMARNFWDKFIDIEVPCTRDSSAIHGVDSISFEEAFGAYARILSMADAKSVKASLEELFSNLDSLAMNGERKPLLAIMRNSEHYFYNPNSPVLDEEIYLNVLNGILSARSLSDLDKMQYEYQHRICSLNRVGTPAADFAFRQLVTENPLSAGNPQLYSATPPKGYADRTLYKDVKGEYTLLFFNNPDCSACGERLDAIKNSYLSSLVQQKKLTIVAMYTDEDLAAWSRNRSKYPTEWIYAFDHKLILRNNDIYGLRAIPSLYLLDKEKRVILKDATIDMVMERLQEQTSR